MSRRDVSVTGGSRELLVAVVSLGMICFSSIGSAQEPSADLTPKFYWRVAHERFRQAGDEIGQGRLLVARQTLEAAAGELEEPYRDMAEVHLRSLKSLSGMRNRNLRNGYYAYAAAGKLCSDLGAYEAAVKWTRRAIEVQPAEARNHLSQLAWCLGESGDYAKAVALYRERIEFLNRADSAVQDLDAYETLERLRGKEVGELSALHKAIGNRYRPMGAARPAMCFAALDTITEFISHATTHEAQSCLYWLAFDYLSKLQDASGRQAWEDDLLEKTAGNDDIASTIVIDRAKRAYDRHQLDEALRLYRTASEGFPRAKPYGVAQYNVAYLLQKQSKFAEAITEYQKLIDSDVNDRDPGDNIMSAFRNYRHLAVGGIAKCYQAQGDFAKALGYYVAARDEFTYQSWCGTCQESSEQSIADLIEECLLRLGRHDELAVACLKDLGGSHLAPSRAIRLVRVYRDAGQTSALIKMLDDADTATLKMWDARGYTPTAYYRSLPSWSIRESLRIAELGAVRDTRELISIALTSYYPGADFSENSHETWRAQAAADALADIGEIGFQAISDHYALGHRGGPWLVYAVAKSNGRNSMEWLRNYLSKPNNWQQIQTGMHALLYKGEAGREEVRRLAGRLLELDPQQDKDEFRHILSEPGGDVKSAAWHCLQKGAVSFESRLPSLVSTNSLPTELPNTEQE